MKTRSRLVILAFLIPLLGTPARAQLKDLPSQAEFDPILENVDAKIKDFIATLAEFRVEAAAMDPERLDTDLKEFQQLRQMIRSTETGPTDHNGINMQRLVIILSGVDDAALEAATWKSLAELHMCQELVRHQDPTQYSQFSTLVAMQLSALREAGRQLFHPTFRMAGAEDDIIVDMLSNATQKNRPARH